MTLAFERIVNYLEHCEPTSGGTGTKETVSETEVRVAEALARSMKADPLVPAKVRLEALRGTKFSS